jgi:hypothetical protein
MNNQVDTSLPPKIFEREFGQITLRQLFEKDDNGDYVKFNALDDRVEASDKKFRIPNHQRFNNFSDDDKYTLIDSVYRGYIIGGISISRHIHADGFYFNIEDAQSRLTIFQEYLDDKFTFKGKLFSERTLQEKERFYDYAFHTEEVSALTSARRDTITTIDDHYYEQFDRINRGKSLTDNDKYWCKKSKPFVVKAINLIEYFHTNAHFNFMGCETWLKKDKKGRENRNQLEKICTLLGMLINDIYKKSYSRHYEKIGEQISDITSTYINNFINFYKSIYDIMYEVMPKEDNEKILNFNDPGKFMSMVVYDYKDESTSNQDKIDMWVNILNINRKSDNFMKGSQSLYNGLAKADKGNQEKNNIEVRLNRIRSFNNDKENISNTFNIEYEEP